MPLSAGLVCIDALLLAVALKLQVQAYLLMSFVPLWLCVCTCAAILCLQGSCTCF